MLHDAEGGEVGEGPGDDDVRLLHRGLRDAEQVQGTDGDVTQPQRQGGRRLEAGLEGSGGKRRPAAGPGIKVLVPDALAGAEGIQAGAFLLLELEQLQQAHRLAGGGHQPQGARGRSQHHPGGGDAEQVDAPVRDPGQQVDDVIVVDEGVGHLDQ
jgi:hypothetical protein